MTRLLQSTQTPLKQFVEVSAGHVIFCEGQSADYMYIILSGEVEVIVMGKQTNLLKAGQILGELALINNKPRTYTTIAKTQCTLLAVNIYQFESLITASPQLALNVVHLLSKSLLNSDATFTFAY